MIGVVDISKPLYPYIRRQLEQEFVDRLLKPFWEEMEELAGQTMKKKCPGGKIRSKGKGKGKGFGKGKGPRGIPKR